MDLNQTQDYLCRILKDHLGLQELNLETSLEGSLDSLDTVELVMMMEDEFNIQIDDDVTDQLAKTTNVRQMAGVLQPLLASVQG